MTYGFTTGNCSGRKVKVLSVVKKRNVSYMLKQTPERHRKLPIVLSGVLLFLSKRGYFLLY